MGDKILQVVTNEELVSIRGFKPGEYVINAHLYSADNNPAERPVPVFKVSLLIQKMNPNVSTVYEGMAEIGAVRQEVHIVRFTLGSDGTASGFSNDMPTFLRQQVPSDDEGGRYVAPPINGGG